MIIGHIMNVGGNMSLIIILISLALLGFLVMNITKRIAANDKTIRICTYMFVCSVILLFFLIPNKMDYVIEQSKLEMVLSSEMPSVPNQVLVSVDASKQYIVVKPDGPISNIRFYLLEYKNDQLLENSLIKTVDQLLETQTLVIETVVPEGVPNIKMKWITKNYVEGEFIISYDGKNGGIYNNATYKHTFRSILMSLLK